MDTATLDRLVAAIKAEILADIRTGTLPADIDTFSALHDHVDANMYGYDVWCTVRDDDETPEQDSTQIALLNAAQGAIDVWLQAGRD